MLLSTRPHSEDTTMRDYANMPVLDWNEEQAALRAKAQILHQEPVILQMPDDFDPSLGDTEFHCSLDVDTGILHDCPGGEVLIHLARTNRLKDLNMLAEACVESSSQVDVDPEHKRLIVHD